MSGNLYMLRVFLRLEIKGSAHDLERDFLLPFVPYPGLILDLEDEGWTDLAIEGVFWGCKSQRFSAWAELKWPEEDLQGLREWARENGWILDVDRKTGNSAHS